MARSIDVKAILANPDLRRDLLVATIIATQAREGIETTREQAERAYDRVQEERSARPSGSARRSRSRSRR
jgi:hypothetical protein